MNIETIMTGECWTEEFDMKLRYTEEMVALYTLTEMSMQMLMFALSYESCPIVAKNWFYFKKIKIFKL